MRYPLANSAFRYALLSTIDFYKFDARSPFFVSFSLLYDGCIVRAVLFCGVVFLALRCFSGAVSQEYEGCSSASERVTLYSLLVSRANWGFGCFGSILAKIEGQGRALYRMRAGRADECEGLAGPFELTAQATLGRTLGVEFHVYVYCLCCPISLTSMMGAVGSIGLQFYPGYQRLAFHQGAVSIMIMHQASGITAAGHS